MRVKCHSIYTCRTVITFWGYLLLFMTIIVIIPLSFSAICSLLFTFFPRFNPGPPSSKAKVLMLCHIQPSYPLSSPSPPAFNLSQHQGLFKWVSSSHQVAKVLRVSASTSVLPVNTQDWSLGERKLTSRLLNRLLTNLSSYGRNPFKYFLYNTGQEATVRTRDTPASAISKPGLGREARRGLHRWE